MKFALFKVCEGVAGADRRANIGSNRDFAAAIPGSFRSIGPGDGRLARRRGDPKTQRISLEASPQRCILRLRRSIEQSGIRLERDEQRFFAAGGRRDAFGERVYEPGAGGSWVGADSDANGLAYGRFAGHVRGGPVARYGWNG